MDNVSFDLGPFEAPLSPSPNDTHQPADARQSERRNEKHCTPAKLAATVNYINLKLTAYGYPVPIVLKDGDDDQLCKVADVLCELLQDKQDDAHVKEELNMDIIKLKKEQEHLQAKLEKCEKALRDQKAEVSQMRAKMESVNNQLNAERDQTRKVKEELSKAKNNMQYMKTQYAHETRRHELEHAKTRERLYKQMNERYKTNVGSLTMNDPLPTLDTFTVDEVGVSTERSMFTDMLTKSSEREKEARMESDKLRSLLADICSAIASLLDRRKHAKNNNTTPKPTNVSELQRRFDLPLNVGGEAAIKQVHELLKELSEAWDAEIEQRPIYMEKEIAAKDDAIRRLEEINEELLNTLEYCQTEFDEKAKMYMRFAEGGFFDMVNPAQLSDSESSIPEEPQQKSKLYRLRTQLLLDRRRTTESALKLGDERAQLEAERRAFEELKRTHKMKEILDSIPDSPERPNVEEAPSSSRRRLSRIDANSLGNPGKRFKS